MLMWRVGSWAMIQLLLMEQLGAWGMCNKSIHLMVIVSKI